MGGSSVIGVKVELMSSGVEVGFVIVGFLFCVVGGKVLCWGCVWMDVGCVVCERDSTTAKSIVGMCRRDGIGVGRRDACFRPPLCGVKRLERCVKFGGSCWSYRYS